MRKTKKKEQTRHVLAAMSCENEASLSLSLTAFSFLPSSINRARADRRDDQLFVSRGAGQPERKEKFPAAREELETAGGGRPWRMVWPTGRKAQRKEAL